MSKLDQTDRVLRFMIWPILLIILSVIIGIGSAFIADQSIRNLASRGALAMMILGWLAVVILAQSKPWDRRK
jgi:hypothetical protein